MTKATAWLAHEASGEATLHFDKTEAMDASDCGFIQPLFSGDVIIQIANFVEELGGRVSPKEAAALIRDFRIAS